MLMGATENSSHDSPVLAAALWHARQGRPVFPCGPHKRPLLAKGRGFLDATLDPDKIRGWWTEFPTSMIGMPTGKASGWWVLDVDRHGEVRGDQTLSELEDVHGKLPDTVQSITPTGGWHLMFTLPRDGRKVVSRSNNLGPGLDVRGDGGYVILPPSCGAAGAYAWEGSSDPADGVAAVAAPAWLLERVCERPAASVPEAGTRPVLGRTPSRAEVVAAFAVLSPDPYDGWVQAGMALHASGVEWGFAEWDAWSQRSDKYPGHAAMVAKWGSFGRHAGAGVSMGTLFAAAKAAGWELPAPVRIEGPMAPAPPLEAYTEDFQERPAGKPKLRVVGGTDHDQRPLIELRAGEMPQVVDAAERHLIASQTEIFQHGTRLVRVGAWDQGEGPVLRPTGGGVLIDISPEWLGDTLGRAIRWERFDARKGDMKVTDCPAKVAVTLLARVGSWHFPGLVGFCDSPTLDRTGRLVSDPGYDRESGLYLCHPPPMAPMGELDRHAAEGAGDLLDEAIGTFPFVSEADRSACLALIMTALLRRVLPAAPIGCISANTPGTGKSKLVDVISAIATGRAAAVAALGTTPEETEKRVDSVLLKGDTLCSFDNIDRAVKSDVLCQVTTQPMKSIRVMGLSKIVEAPTNVALFMTGNNLTPIGDLVRRCVMVNLDAQCERPELREFTRDAVEYALERRASLIRAALMLSKAYLDAGAPKLPVPPFGSFELWDKLIRRPLIWAGWPDPLGPSELLREQDHELVGMRDFLRAWQIAAPDPVTAVELSELIRSRVPLMGGDWQPRWPELHDAAIQVMGDINKWGARELGYRLRALAGRLFDGRRVRKSEKGKSGVRWWAESVA